MREIKFRGQRSDNKRWVTGGYFGCQEEEVFVHYIFSQPNGAESIDPKTLGQFTSLTDKNGKEIYEGDILKFDVGTRKYRKVIFQSGCFGLVGLQDDREKTFTEFIPFGMIELSLIEQGIYTEVNKLIEVVGNIYDNKEFLIS